MSSKYPGGFITKSPVAPTAFAASGIWTVDQAMQYRLAGTWPAPPSTIVDDYFSSFALVGNGSSNTMYTGSSGPAVSLSTIGGLTWVKNRSTVSEHVFTDTIRGVNSQLSSSSTAAATTNTNCVTGFFTNQFTTGANSLVNGSGNNIIGWTFGRRIKFFDIVTYTGNGSTQTINHNLASVPGVIICKSTTSARNWLVYHQSLGNTNFLQLDTAIASTASSTAWNNTSPTSTQFTVGSSLAGNENGQTYVAYLFAHNAGSFGSSGTENAITCGSFTTGASGYSGIINLGFEPQFLLLKNVSTSDSWQIIDTMRGMTATGRYVFLNPNKTDVESGVLTNTMFVNSTGFYMDNILGSNNYIYIAVRKAMYTPSDYYRNYANFNFGSENTTPTTYPNQFVTGFWNDLVIEKFISGTASNRWVTRLQGNTLALDSTSTNAESVVTNDFTSRTQYVIVQGTAGTAGTAYGYVFKRGTGMLDIVCYTGTGSALTVNHNLGVAPELIITKRRNAVTDWYVYCQYVSSYNTAYAQLNTSNQFFTNGAIAWDAAATSYNASTFLSLSASGGTYIAYLWATVPGVSKVGTYTGTGTLQSIDCGFNSSTKTFIMIKRTDATGDWYVFNSGQGMSGAADPYWLMNSTAAQVSGTNYVDNTTAGFQVTAAASTTVNVSGGTYIYLAIC